MLEWTNDVTILELDLCLDPRLVHLDPPEYSPVEDEAADILLAGSRDAGRPPHDHLAQRLTKQPWIGNPPFSAPLFGRWVVEEQQRQEVELNSSDRTVEVVLRLVAAGGRCQALFRGHLCETLTVRSRRRRRRRRRAQCHSIQKFFVYFQECCSTVSEPKTFRIIAYVTCRTPRQQFSSG